MFSSSRWLSYFTSSLQNADGENDQQREAQQQETDRLARHFETTVTAADEYNSELLQLVASKIYEADGLDACCQEETRSLEEEAAKANKVKTLTFARFIASIWSVPLTFLLCRLLFCIYGKSEIKKSEILLSIGRVVYLSNVAAAIHTTRTSAYLGGARMQCPPLFDASYQRRLLRTFKSITPDAICRHFFRMVCLNKCVCVCSHLCGLRFHKLWRNMWNISLIMKRPLRTTCMLYSRLSTARSK